MNLGSYKPSDLLNYFTKHVVFGCCHLVLKVFISRPSEVKLDLKCLRCTLRWPSPWVMLVYVWHGKSLVQQLLFNINDFIELKQRCRV